MPVVSCRVRMRLRKDVLRVERLEKLPAAAV